MYGLIKLIKNDEDSFWRQTLRLIVCTRDPKHLPSDAEEWRLLLMVLVVAAEAGCLKPEVGERDFVPSQCVSR